MRTVMLGGREIPVLYLAIALPTLIGLYVAYQAFMAEDGAMAIYNQRLAKVAELEQKHAEAQELKNRTKKIGLVKAEIEEMSRTITLLKSRIPGEAQVPVLLFDLERIARASEGTINSFEPGELKPFTPPEGVSAEGMADIMELPVKVRATASYPQVIQFLQKLNAYERKLNVNALSLSPGAKAEVLPEAGKGSAVFKNFLSVDFSFSAYVLKRGGP